MWPHALSLRALVGTYGYGAVFVLTFLEGEAILVLAGVAAHQGYLALDWVIASAFAGTFLGDQLYFAIGYHIGPEWLERRAGLRPTVDRLIRLLRRHEVLPVLLFRFVYGLRTIASFVFGAARMRPLDFLWLNACGALLWSVAIAGGGYLSGHLFQKFVEGFQRYELIGITGLVIVVSLWVLLRVVGRRRG